MNKRIDFFRNQIGKDKWQFDYPLMDWLKAEALEAESEQANEASEHAMHPHHRLAQSMTLIQIAIALASITVLTRKKWLFSVAAVAAAGGLVLWGFAFMA